MDTNKVKENPAIGKSGLRQTRKDVILSLCKEVLLYNILELVILFTSITILALGIYGQAEIVLGRRRWNLLGVVGSYFIHKDVWHAIGNFAFYFFSTFIVLLFNKIVDKINIDKESILVKFSTWKAWNLLVILLMPIIGVTDLLLNKIYQLGIVSVGISDLVSALLVIALAFAHLLVFWLIREREKVNTSTRRTLLSYVFIYIIIMSLMLILLFNLQAINEGVNVPAHGIGACIGFGIASILLWLGEKRQYSSYIPLITYVLNVIAVLLGWEVINS